LAASATVAFGSHARTSRVMTSLMLVPIAGPPLFDSFG
jgi:hypothetical protein